MTAESPSVRYAATNAIAGKIAALRDEMRATVPAVDDPQAKALLETGAEVLNGLQHAFIDYADGSEEAWQR
ncbi:MAG: hypothetical protein M3Y77_19380 [Actinomycetota bacterium]|nr:hypothetical protein [Actinomycetota bacterium]